MGLGSLGFGHPRLGPRQLSRPPLAAWRACLSPSPAGRCGAGRHAQKSKPDHDFELFGIAHIFLALSYIVHLKNLGNMCNIAFIDNIVNIVHLKDIGNAEQCFLRLLVCDHLTPNRQTFVTNG